MLVDREYLCRGSRYLAGIERSQGGPTSGTAAALLCGAEDKQNLEESGFRLLYRSPPDAGHDVFRLYAVAKRRPEQES